MPVAVRLVEALALITIMGLVTCIGLCVVMAQHTLTMALTFLEPAADIANLVLIMTEKILVSSLLCLLSVTSSVTSALHAVGMA
ncbi:hypothetical protein KR018_008252 [Drosophila ironensis]|nr:hypothetical protein KR018_008252 [Drosophila ironensis]